VVDNWDYGPFSFSGWSLLHFAYHIAAPFLLYPILNLFTLYLIMLDLCHPTDPLILIVSTLDVTPMSAAAGLMGNDGPKHLEQEKVILLSSDEEILARGLSLYQKN
jgi:hypothetical protein